MSGTYRSTSKDPVDKWERCEGRGGVLGPETLEVQEERPECSLKNLSKLDVRD